MGVFMFFGGFGQQKNKPKQTQLPLAPSTAGGLNTNLKKQSQFAPGLIGVKFYLKGDYDEKPVERAEKNKAKQSQLLGPDLIRSGY